MYHHKFHCKRTNFVNSNIIDKDTISYKNYLLGHYRMTFNINILSTKISWPEVNVSYGFRMVIIELGTRTLSANCDQLHGLKTIVSEQ